MERNTAKLVPGIVFGSTRIMVVVIDSLTGHGGLFKTPMAERTAKEMI